MKKLNFFFYQILTTLKGKLLKRNTIGPNSRQVEIPRQISSNKMLNAFVYTG